MVKMNWNILTLEKMNTLSETERQSGEGLEVGEVWSQIRETEKERERFRGVVGWGGGCKRERKRDCSYIS